MPYRGREHQPGIDLVAPVEMDIKQGDTFRIVEVAFDVRTLNREQPVPLPSDGIFKVEEFDKPGQTEARPRLIKPNLIG